MAFSLLTLGVGVFCALTVIEAVPARMATHEGELSLYLIKAGPVGAHLGGKLVHGSVVCPKMYPDGFSVVCEGVAVASKKVKFTYDGKKVKIEKKIPYTIAGDTNGIIKPWKKHGAGGTIKCITEYGSVEALVTFACDDDAPAGSVDEESAGEPSMTTDLVDEGSTGTDVMGKSTPEVDEMEMAPVPTPSDSVETEMAAMPTPVSVDESEMPAMPSSSNSDETEKPEKPVMDKPEKPVMDKPEEPEWPPVMNKPEKPVMDKPEEPEWPPAMDKPDYPEKPVMDKPEKPVMSKPEKSEKPVMDKPEKPEKPVMDKPEKPKKPAKGMPSASEWP